MLRMLSLTCAAGALLVAASTANAASECRGGYRELGNGVIVSCHGDYGYEPPPVFVAPAGLRCAAGLCRAALLL